MILASALGARLLTAAGADAAQSVAGGLPPLSRAAAKVIKYCSQAQDLYPADPVGIHPVEPLDVDTFLTCVGSVALIQSFAPTAEDQEYGRIRTAVSAAQVPSAALGSEGITQSPLADGNQVLAWVTIQAAAPAVFTLNTSNLAAAVAICGSSTGNTIEPVYQVISGAIAAVPVNLSGCLETVLEVYATGIDALTASQVQATIGGLPAVVQYAGPQGVDAGLDQINIVIPPSLTGQGNVPIAIAAAGQTANGVNITVQ
jgi:uncharacterized protein (TIGR03437 family)